VTVKIEVIPWQHKAGQFGVLETRQLSGTFWNRDRSLLIRELSL
jgi:hypothetical protein